MGEIITEINAAPLVKKCFVITCPNSTETSPSKVFVRVPMNSNRRKWFKAAGISCCTVTTNVFCCEDHFDLKNDTKMLYSKRSGATSILRKEVVPHLKLPSYKVQFDLTKLPSFEHKQVVDFAKDFFYGKIEGRKLVSKQIYCVDDNEIEELQILSTINVTTQTNDCKVMRKLYNALDKIPLNTDDDYPTEIDTTASLADLSLSCRTCLKVMPATRNLARPGKSKLLQTLEKLVQVPVTLNEHGVYNTCKRCETRLENILSFQQMCIYTHKKYLHEIGLKKASNRQSDATIVPPLATVKRNTNKRKCASAYDPMQQKNAINAKKPRLCNVNKKVPLSTDEILIHSQNPLLSNFSDPWVVNNEIQIEQSEEIISDDNVEPCDLIDPLALTEMDGSRDPFASRLDEAIDPLSLETPPATVSRTIVLHAPSTQNHATIISAKARLKSRLEAGNNNIPSNQFQRPKVVLVKRLNPRSKPVPNPQLVEPFPQRQLPKYFVVKHRNTVEKKQQNKTKLANINRDHCYALKKRRKCAQLGARAYLRQYCTKDVTFAIEELCREIVKQKTLLCLFCQFSTDNVFALSTHMMKIHEEKFPKWCCRCNKMVEDQRAHRKERVCCKLYSCQFCFKRFKKSATLLQHLEYHNQKHFFPNMWYNAIEGKPKRNKPTGVFPKLYRIVETAPLKTLVKPVNSSLGSEINPYSRDPLNISETSKIVESKNPSQKLLSPRSIKHEIVDSNIELQKLLNEEIHIKEEPFSIPEDECADNLADQMEIPSKTQVIRVKVPKGITDIVITDRSQKEVKKLHIEPTTFMQITNKKHI